MTYSVLEEKWPILGRHEHAARWLRMWADLGRASRTIDAYGVGLAEYLEVCEREGVDPVVANREHIARYVRELSARPGRRGANVVSIDSGAGLSNATLQQRLVPVRLLYDFLIEEGLRESNPVGRGGLGFPRNRGDFLKAVSCNFRRLLFTRTPVPSGSLQQGFPLTRGLLPLPVSHGVPRSG